MTIISTVGARGNRCDHDAVGDFAPLYQSETVIQPRGGSWQEAWGKLARRSRQARRRAARHKLEASAVGPSRMIEESDVDTATEGAAQQACKVHAHSRYLRTPLHCPLLLMNDNLTRF